MAHDLLLGEFGQRRRYPAAEGGRQEIIEGLAGHVAGRQHVGAPAGNRLLETQFHHAPTFAKTSTSPSISARVRCSVQQNSSPSDRPSPSPVSGSPAR